MLGVGSYLLGVMQIVALAGFAWLGAAAARQRLVPDLTGAPSHLATSVLALALLICSAELLGSFGAFEPLPYLLTVGVIGVGTWALCRRVLSEDEGGAAGQAVLDPPHPLPPAGGASKVAAPVALAIAAAAVVKFGAEVKVKLGTGMTGFDSTWYHGPFAAGFAQSGNTWDLHHIAPQFLAWFYPANSELLHAVGMNAFDRDLLSPLLNLGWFVGCLVACWCIGRPYRVAPWSLGLGAIALSVPALSDQAGEARNDIVGIFFLLAAVAIALNAWAAQAGGGVGDGDLEGPEGAEGGGFQGLPTGALILAGLAAGLAAGTKLNFLLSAAVLVVGLAAVAPRGRRLSGMVATGLAALAGGGYWYLRNLVHTGNPLPWFDNLGPVSLPAPDQALGGREGHSVLGYLGDGSVWSDWFLPGLHHGLWVVWPLVVLAAAAGLILALQGFRRSFGPNGDQREQRRGGRDPVTAVAGLAGLAAAFAWLIAPTSASGPEGMPRGFESGLRYLAPALVLGLALLPVVPPVRDRLARWALGGRAVEEGQHVVSGARTQLFPDSGNKGVRAIGGHVWSWGLGMVAIAVAVVAGYFAQREYLRDRYANPTFAAPGLNAAFKWATPLADSRIATTSTRQYPLFGTDLSNRVEFVGEERPNGGFVAPSTCRAWRRLLDAGGYDYVVASRDRVEPGKPPYPKTARWTEGPGATVVLRQPPTVVFKLIGPLDPSICSS